MTGAHPDEVFERAAAYIRTEARELERARLEYHFGSGDRRPVLSALAEFQNADGGFGHGLEPDLRTPASSVLATTVALGVIAEAGATESEPVVERAVAYLIAAYDDQTGVWPIIPPEADEAPRAWWWDYADAAANFQDFKVNPRADVLAYLWRYQKIVPDAFLRITTARTVDDIVAMPDEFEQHDLRCLLRLIETPTLPDEPRGRLLRKAESAVRTTVATEPAQWGEYGLMPLDVVPRPEAPMRAVVGRAVLDANLDHLIDTQADDGSWQPAWSWADRFPQAWATAEREWRGVLTLNNLRVLDAYQRIG